jgi:ubiquinone/menaquinone biosynthesis C-methylase UbiE
MSKWDSAYRSIRTLGTVDAKSNPELRDAYFHVHKYQHYLNQGLFLEAGCGSSRLSCLLAKEGAQVVGLDSSFQALLLSKRLFEMERVKGSFVCADIMDMPFKNNSFLYIYTGGVLEHFKNTKRAVDNIYRCLAHGGFTTNTVPCLSLSALYRILMWGHIPDVPFVRSLLELIEIDLLRGRRMRFGYEKSFLITTIRRIFNRAGFRKVDTGLFRTYYVLDWAGGDSLRDSFTKIANSHRIFWPMIYVSAFK